MFTEQYVINLNIEAETAASIARTMLLPAAVRYLNELKASGLDELTGEVEPVIKEFHFALRKLEDANLDENHPEGTPRRRRSTCATRVSRDGRRARGRRPAREAVADDLWPLPKYSEMLFIK